MNFEIRYYRILILCIFAMLGVFSIPRLLHAQSSIVNAEFRRPNSSEFITTRDHALSDLAQLDSFLGSGPNANAWRGFLQLSELRQMLVQHEPPAFQPIDLQDRDYKHTDAETLYLDRLQQLRTMAAKFIGKHEGLERSPLLRVRASLKQLVLATELSVDASLEEVFKAKRNAIIELLAQPNLGDIEFHRQLAQLASWLDQYDQAEAWTADAIARWSRPNLRLGISREAMQHVTIRSVCETKPIHEIEDGRRITGQALATGHAYMVPIDSTSTSMLGHGLISQCRVEFDGNIQSSLNGSEGPISFGLLGNTRLTTYLPVAFSTKSFVVFPIQATSSTNLQTRHVSTRRNGIGSRLVRKVATRVIEKKRPESERGLDEGAVERFSKSFMEDVTKEIREAEIDFKSDMIAALDRVDMQPHDFQFVGDASKLEVQMTLNGGFGLGASPLPPPPITAPVSLIPSPRMTPRVAADLYVQVHESTVDRIAQRMLAGETVRDFSAVIRAAGFALSEDQAAELPKDLVIELANDRPVTATFDNDMLKLVVRCAAFQVGRARPVALNIVIRYRVTVDAGKLRLDLEGEPEITPPETGSTIRFITLKNVVARRLEPEIPKSKSFDGFNLPAPADRLGYVWFDTAHAENGWMTITFRGDH